MPIRFCIKKYSARRFASGNGNSDNTTSSILAWPDAENSFGRHLYLSTRHLCMCCLDAGLNDTTFFFMKISPLTYPSLALFTLGKNSVSIVHGGNKSSSSVPSSSRRWANLAYSSDAALISNVQPLLPISRQISARSCSRSMLSWENPAFINWL